MSRLSTVLLAAWVAAAAALCPAGEASFSAKPTATKAGEGVKIAFAVSGPTDVELAVLDAAGKVVRHLGGGLLGENPPAPFRKGLAQEILWDGKDDLGKPAAGGPFKVRVGLGLRAEFDRIVGWNGQNMDYPRAMAVASDGTLYALHGKTFSAHRRTSLITAYDREGRYLRQVFPSPGGLSAAQRTGWPHVALPDGAEVPVVHHVLTRCVHPGVFFGDGDESNLAVTPDGKRLVAVGGSYSSKGAIKNSDTREGRRLLVFSTDGTVPERPLGPVVVPEGAGGQPFLAVDPGGKYVYVSGFGGEKAPDNAVYRVEIDADRKAEAFVPAGSGKAALNAPRGVAVDGAGNVYVADSGNRRVAVFRASGEFLGEIPAGGAAEDLAVSRRTGAVYARIGQKLVKFGGLKKPEKLAEAEFPRPAFKSDRAPSCTMALDDSGDAPALYLGSVIWIKSGFGRFLDRGSSFEPQDDPVNGRLGKEDPGLPFVNQVAVVPGRLLAAMPRVPDCNSQYMSYDPETGRYLGEFSLRKPGGGAESFKDLHFCGGETSAGKDGRLYHQTGGFDWPEKKSYTPGTLRRYGADGAAAPFPALDNYFIKKYYGGHHRQAGRFATPAGDVYLAAFAGYRGRDQQEPGLDVTVISPEGAVKQPSLVKAVGVTVGGIAVDPRGNVYLGVQAWPRGKRLPEFFDGRLPESSAHGHPQRAYQQHGAIVKFPPTGGRIVLDPAGDYSGSAGGYAVRKEWPTEKDGSVRLKFENVEWYRRGGYIAINDLRYEVGCSCENTRFDADAQGRILVPDLFRFRVTVLDGAGNQVTHFGGYGNMDNRGPGSPRPEPAIPFGWPVALQVHGERVYVADTNNRRIVAVKLSCAASETVAVP